MNIIWNLRNRFRFFRLGWAEGLENNIPEDAQCLRHNEDAFKAEVTVEAGPHAEDVPPKDASPEDAFLHLRGEIERRILELVQLLHEHGHRLFTGTGKFLAHLLVLLFVSFETAIARPALIDIFPDTSFSSSVGYVGALIAGLTVLIHISGTSLKSRRLWMASFALLLVVATNGLLIAVRATAFGGSGPILVGLFTCVALMVTTSGIWLTYRMATNETIIGPPSVNLEALEREYKTERRTLRCLHRSYGRYKALKRAFYQGYYAQRIRRIAAMKILRLARLAAFGLMAAGLVSTASAFEVLLDATPRSLPLGGGPVTLRLNVDANDPERFVNALTGSRIHLSGPGISEAYRLKTTAEIRDWSWTPTRPGSYRIRFSSMTRGDYPVSAQAEVEVVEPDHGFSSPVDVEFVPESEFEVRIPVPEVPYAKLDFRIVQDTSGSMGDEIADVLSSNQAIFEHLMEFSSDPTVSVVVFSDVRENPSGPLEPLNYRMVLPPTSDPARLADLQITTNGGNEATYYALRYAAALGQFREDALRFLLLVTDEADNIYDGEIDLERDWHPDGRLSLRSILGDLRDQNISAAVLHSGMTLEEAADAYGNPMEQILGTGFAGAHPLSSSSADTAQRVAKRIHDALDHLAGQTVFTLELDRAESGKWIEAITPVGPMHCIEGNGFQLERLRNAGASEMVFKVRLAGSAPQVPERLFLIGKSDKGTVNHTVPVILRN